MSTSCWLVYLCMQSLWNSTLITIYMELWLQFLNAIIKKKISRVQTIVLFRPSQSHRCVTTLLYIIIDQWSCFSEGEILTNERFQLGKVIKSKNSKYISILNNFVKDIEKFYELNQQLSMDDLARSISFTMKSGQWTMQKIPFSGEGQHTQGFAWWEWWAE